MFYRIVATVLFIGYFPIAPGTITSAMVMIMLLIFKPSHIVILSILILSFILGVFTSAKIEKQKGEKDPPYVVIDEFTGYLTAVLFIPLNTQNLLLALIIFRIFDVFKIPPVRQIEKKLGGGFGIMIDDVISGLLTNMIIRIILYI